MGVKYLHLVEISLFIIAMTSFFMENLITRVVRGVLMNSKSITELRDANNNLQNQFNNLTNTIANLESNLANVLSQSQAQSAPESNTAEIEQLLSEANL